MCPPLGQPDARAAWFAAWRALGQPADLTAETTMTTTQLAAAVHAYERAKAWAPDWVAQPLQHHSEAARHQRQQAHLALAQARHQPNPHKRERAETIAHQLLRTSAEHDTAARNLAHADHARATWYANTQTLREAAQRASLELARRQDNKPATAR